MHTVFFTCAFVCMQPRLRLRRLGPADKEGRLLCSDAKDSVAVREGEAGRGECAEGGGMVEVVAAVGAAACGCVW